ncbi:P2X purinoceptor 7-like [Ylistrum balloti]|uniref:P2X purinoceptor 7-like n=1 Tax=Ylistrum balloti TaxID=509963 RepID=UPI002905D9C0|nr:P2X purinoceptor 7-like [Ylistrum balloti]
MDSPDLSDFEDIPEVSFCLNIEPYMYEPQRKQDNDQDDSDSSDHSDDSSDSSLENASPDHDGSTEWCSCNLCTPMPTEEERQCCRDMIILQEKLEDIECITHHEGFIANCLNIHVLETSFYEYADEHGDEGQSQNIHRMYRLVAYRRFIRWTWKRLGKKNRKVIPACAVAAIHRAFPSESFTGFRYPRL